MDEALVYPSSKKKIVIFDLTLQRFVFIFFLLFFFRFVLFCFLLVFSFRFNLFYVSLFFFIFFCLFVVVVVVFFF